MVLMSGIRSIDKKKGITNEKKDSSTNDSMCNQLISLW